VHGLRKEARLDFRNTSARVSGRGTESRDHTP
jgi:hypothetical protein